MRTTSRLLPAASRETPPSEGGGSEVETGEFPFVSLTLARLYASQGHLGLAERVVRLVNPVEADDILGRFSGEAAN